MLNAADFDHRCAEPTCCVYGQRTTTNCLCHKPREQMLLEAIASARAEGWKAGIEAAAKVARERAANIDDTIARTQVATHLAMQLSARLDEVSRLATTIESLGGINPRVDDAHEALLRDLARVERPADADDRPCDDTWEDANLLWDFADRARSALDEGRAPSSVASHQSRQEGEDDGG